MEEIWIDIKGYEDIYQVSNLGSIKSLDRYVEHRNREVFVSGRVLKQTNRNGYLRVILSKNGIPKHINVHRLVAEYFVMNPESKEYVHHVDCNKKNNRYDNLEWVTNYENSHDAWEKGLYISGSRSTDSKLSISQVETILKYYYVDGLYQKDIAKKYSVSQTFVSEIVRGKSWHFSEDKNLTNILDYFWNN